MISMIFLISHKNYPVSKNGSFLFNIFSIILFNHDSDLKLVFRANSKKLKNVKNFSFDACHNKCTKIVFLL